MPRKKNQLTSREIRTLSYLAKGKTYAEIQAAMGISQDNVHTICFILRAKLGIKQTRDKEECQRAIATIPKERILWGLNPTRRPKPRKLTDTEMEVLRFIAAGYSYMAIAHALGIKEQSVQNHASRACKHATIQHDGWNRTAAIKQWLARLDIADTPAEADPMEDPAF